MSDDTPDEPAQSKRRPQKRWLIVGAVGIAVVVAVLVLVVLRVMKPASVTAGKLDSALLDAGQLNTILGTDGMQISDPLLAPAKPTVALSKPECLGALTAAQAPTYVDRGYTGFRSTEARPAGKRVDHYAAQAVAAFPDTDKANAFVKRSAEQWSGCANATVVVMQANKSVNVWTIETVVGDPPSISILEARRDVGWRCQRAMRAVSDVVIDATACGQDITDQASSLADRIAANISK
jgi:hypothetical protein